MSVRSLFNTIMRNQIIIKKKKKISRGDFLFLLFLMNKSFGNKTGIGGNRRRSRNVSGTEWKTVQSERSSSSSTVISTSSERIGYRGRSGTKKRAGCFRESSMDDRQRSA